MKPPILVVFATREGHTRRIAEHIGATIRARGFDAEVRNAAWMMKGTPLSSFSAAVLVGSVHRGAHEEELVAFVKEHRDELQKLPSAFISSSLSEAGAEDETAEWEARFRASEEVQGMIDDFFTTTGWHPSRVKAVAGALVYSKYNRLVRLVMQFIALRAGAPTDPNQDYVFTDWKALDRFIDELTQEL